MLDIKFIRENKDVVAAGAKKKHINFNVDELISVDDERRALLLRVEEKRAKQNAVSEKIPKATPEEKAALLAEMKVLKEDLQKDDEALRDIVKKWQLLMVQVPNVPDMTVPDGDDDADNQEVKKWGEQNTFSFPAKNHIDLMTSLDMVDLEKGAEVAGFRGYFLKNGGATLSFAIWNYARDFWMKRGFQFMIVPSLVRKQTLLGSGYLPQGEEDLYKTQDEDYLAEPVKYLR